MRSRSSLSHACLAVSEISLSCACAAGTRIAIVGERSRKAKHPSKRALSDSESLGFRAFLVLVLQESLGYSPIEAGLATLPITMIMLAVSARAGALAQRIGPRVPMTLGPAVMAVGTSSPPKRSRRHPPSRPAAPVCRRLLLHWSR